MKLIETKLIEMKLIDMKIEIEQQYGRCLPKEIH